MPCNKKKYHKKGQAGGSSVSAIIGLIVGVGVSVLVLIFVGTLSGNVYELSEDKIADIGRVYTTNSTGSVVYNYTNKTISGPIERSIESSFEALEQTGDYLPIIVLAVIIAIVLGLVFTMGGIGGGMKGGGTAL